MFECYFCGERTVAWQCDYDFQDFGYDGDGIVQVYYCSRCGADIEYMIPFNNEDEEETEKGESD